ncbi:MAG: peroxidase [Planctomycetaceae bacterium]|nr:peroxidase [Planctomycetaceae bacterium]
MRQSAKKNRGDARRHRRRRLQLESLERRELLAADLGLPDAYAPDGLGNNLAHVEWGSTDEPLLRLAAAEYGDGISTPAGADRPGAREISNALSDQGGDDIISDRNLSAFIYAWGQFIDHDIGLTPTAGTELLAIPVPTGDPYFDPAATGTQAIYTSRSIYDLDTGDSADNPREQVNTITAWIDGSMVYGSDQQRADALRTFSGGKLKMSADGMLPLNNEENFPDGTLAMANDAHRVADDELFAAGDARANENIELTSLHTLFVREHNRLADQIAERQPELSDEEIYQRARSLVIAEIQAITYNEWLPSLLGRGALDRYDGYDSSVNPGISNEFATAAFRFGHSQLGDDIEFLDDNGLEARDAVSLAQAFFNPDLVRETGIDAILKYLSADPSSEVDTELVDSVRNFLFGPPGSGGLDLASLNIQRGRDHGLADYNTVRESVGLSRVTSFSEITSDPELQASLESLYGSVDNIDLWVGGLAEDHLPGSSMGETFQTIIVDQFERLRDGDRFWYQNQFSGRELAQLQRTSLSDIIERNTDLTSVQHNAFIFKAEISGVVSVDQNGNGRTDRREPVARNANVQLVNLEDGSVVATATTDRNGRFSFGVAEGLRTGEYQIVATDTDGNVLASSREVAITGGDDFERVTLAVPGRQMTPPRRSTPPGHGGQRTSDTTDRRIVQASQTNGQRNPPPAANASGQQTQTPNRNSMMSHSMGGQQLAGQQQSRDNAAQLHDLIDSVMAGWGVNAL